MSLKIFAQNVSNRGYVMKYAYSIVFLFFAFIALVFAASEKDKQVKINFGFLCAFCCALSVIVFKLL